MASLKVLALAALLPVVAALVQPRRLGACSFDNEPTVPFFWDESCPQDGQSLGCLADGVHAQCRFCGAGDYSEVLCPAAEKVDLGTAANYAILTKSGISTISSSITGNIGVSPAAGTYMTGFSFTADSSAEFSTSSQIKGFAYAPTDYPPTPTILTTAVSDMETAYTNASQRNNTEGFNLGAGSIGGQTLTTGVYTFNTDINIGVDITFSGGADDVFILQTTGTLMQSASTNVILAGGAQAKNIFWQVAGTVWVGSSAVMQGILLAKTNVVFETGSSLTGRVLAQTACTLQMATITQPADAAEEILLP